MSNGRTTSMAARELADTLDEALELLRDFSHQTAPVVRAGQSPASLLEQCISLCEQHSDVPVEPMRTVHHFACTGGTLISKCIAAMPNTQVLSEVDPLSSLMDTPGQPRFAPTDMVQLMRQSTRGASSELIVELFLSNLKIIHADSTHKGQRLVLRDHAHSHYCVGDDVADRPSFRQIVASGFPVASVITVRHPVDSYLSLKSTAWMHFVPPTFDEYCRRYLVFLHAHGDVPVVKYEDFLGNARQTMQDLCRHLQLPYSDRFPELFSVFALTGDSGRKSDVIESRPRKAVNAELSQEIAGSANYRSLRRLLRYE